MIQTYKFVYYVNVIGSDSEPVAYLNPFLDI